MSNQHPDEGNSFAEMRGEMMRLGYKPKDHPALFQATYDAERKAKISLTASIRRAVAWSEQVIRRLKLERRESETTLQEYRVTTDEKMKILERVALTDPLTGLLNRGGFNRQIYRFVKQLANEKRESLRRDDWAALWVIDLDKFKDINDRLGHLQGDTLLEGLADILRRTVRTHTRYSSGQSVEVNFLSRFGGDEEAVLETKVASWEESHDTAALVKRRYMTENWGTRNPKLRDLPVQTVSIGVVMLPVSSLYGVTDVDGAVKGWFEAADANMYRAKRAGMPVVMTGIRWDESQRKMVTFELEGGPKMVMTTQVRR